MILKIWNEDADSYTYIDGVRFTHRESDWAHIDIKTFGDVSALHKICKNNKGGLFIHGSCFIKYNHDYRNSLKLDKYINKVSEFPELIRDSVDLPNDIKRTHVLDIEFIDGTSTVIAIGDSVNNFILNENGQTIDRL